jgi:hypothetical protein
LENEGPEYFFNHYKHTSVCRCHLVPTRIRSRSCTCVFQQNDLVCRVVSTVGEDRMAKTFSTLIKSILFFFLPIFHVIVGLHLFDPAEFSHNLLYNLDRPKGIEAVENDPKHQQKVLEMPRNTCLTMGILASFKGNADQISP